LIPTAVSENPVDAPATGRLGPILVAVAVTCLVGAGALMWWRQGDVVFASLVTSALAWCF